MNNSRFSPDDKPFHSNEFVKASRGEVLGSSQHVSDTFRKRAFLDRERKHVNKYRDSLVVRHRTLAARYRPLGSDSQRSTPSIDSSATGNRQQAASKPETPSRQRFVEPPQRKYNPYQ